MVSAMDGDLITADDYRDRAQKLRQLAQHVSDEEMRRVLLRVADDYDAMAMSRERLAETDITVAKNEKRD